MASWKTSSAAVAVWSERPFRVAASSAYPRSFAISRNEKLRVESCAAARAEIVFTSGLPGQERRAIKGGIVCRRASGDRFHERASRRSIGQNGQRFFRIEAACTNHGRSLREGRGLHSTKKVIDQLQKCAASVRAKVNNFAAEHKKHWLCLRNRGSRTTGKEKQFACRRLRP